ncbi:MAG: hypothetical protein ABF672_10895, partial [Gluconobacter oxydans]|uniref:hypothetical protein n=1 Tax=Gluconobacter oxydans TaxID=442 RepID=UPI0039ED0B24
PRNYRPSTSIRGSSIPPPFFVAALALIVAFPGNSLDKDMGAEKPTLKICGEIYQPSRREILGYLFSYLSGISIILYLMGGALVSVVSSKNTFAFFHNYYFCFIVKSIYIGLIFHLLCSTLISLHFLGNFLSSSKLSRSN